MSIGKDRSSNTSVVIPAYNCAITMSATLDSVLGQSLQPAEVVVMDDGSTDGMSRILNFYELSVTVLGQTNEGPSAARKALC